MWPWGHNLNKLSKGTPDKVKEALFNVAYNETDNISSQAILRLNNMFNRFLPALLYLPSTSPFMRASSRELLVPLFTPLVWCTAVRFEPATASSESGRSTNWAIGAIQVILHTRYQGSQKCSGSTLQVCYVLTVFSYTSCLPVVTFHR